MYACVLDKFSKSFLRVFRRSKIASNHLKNIKIGGRIKSLAQLNLKTEIRIVSKIKLKYKTNFKKETEFGNEKYIIDYKSIQSYFNH